MKKITSLAVCAALLVAPHQAHSVGPNPGPPRDTALFAICLIGGAVIAGGAVVFLIKTCKPKYYCLRNEDGDYFVSNATKREREVEGWVIVSGPYNSAEAATTNCHKPPPSALTMVSLVYTPAIPIKIWKSTNLVDWVLRDQISDDPAHFSWSETNTLGSACFYRASY